MAGRLATVTQDWEDRIRTMAENSPRVGGRRIWTLLKEKGYPEKDLPSPRTIDRIIARHIGDTEKRIDYRYVYWPESFTRGDLRWETAPAFFELLRWNHHISPQPFTLKQVAQVDDPEWKEQTRRRYEIAQSGVLTNRPTVRMVRALHNVTQAAPNGPFKWRYEMASHLTVEAAHLNRRVEAQIATEVYAEIAYSVQSPNSEGDPK